MVGLLDSLLLPRWRLPSTSDQSFPAPAALPAALSGVPLAMGAGGFSNPYDEANPAGEADAAREAAAARMRKSVRRPGIFGTGDQPIAFGGMLSPEGVLGAPGGIPLDAPPSTNDPQSGEPEVMRDGVPLPRPKPIDATTSGQPIRAPMSLAPPTEEDLSARAQPAQPEAAATGTPTVAPAPSTGSRFLSGLSNALNNNSSTLLALGAGFAGAPSFGTGMSRAFAAAGPAAALDRANTMKQSGIRATYASLVARGVPPAEALAAVYNPDVMKATAAKYFETKPRTSVKLGTDMAGVDIMGSFDPNTGKYFNLAGEEVRPNTDGGGGVASNVPGGMRVLAEGVTGYNPDLPGDQYLEQFGPEVKAAIKSYVSGDTTPTGNPRMKSLATNIKLWAQTYGDKTGIPVSDATFSARRSFRTQLGSGSASAVGGQVKAFNQGIEHAAGLAEKLEKLDNSSGFGIPAVASGINTVRQATSTKQASIAAEAAALGQTLAGEVGKLFSGSQGGGVHERELTRKRFDTVKSPAEMAGALEATIETMEGGLRALEQRRDEVMGPNSGIEFVGKQTQEKIAKIRETVARLKGEAPATASAPSGAPRLQPGEAATINGVTIRRLN